jgi:hypothetical protein
VRSWAGSRWRLRNRGYRGCTVRTALKPLTRTTRLVNPKTVNRAGLNERYWARTSDPELVEPVCGVELVGLVPTNTRIKRGMLVARVTYLDTFRRLMLTRALTRSAAMTGALRTLPMHVMGHTPRR